jgi:hypothetical protein
VCSFSSFHFFSGIIQASSKPLASPFHQTGRPSVVTAHTPLSASAFQQNGFNTKPVASTPSHNNGNNQSQIQSLMQAVQPYLQQPSAMPEALASQLASALGISMLFINLLVFVDIEIQMSFSVFFFQAKEINPLPRRLCSSPKTLKFSDCAIVSITLINWFVFISHFTFF